VVEEEARDGGSGGGEGREVGVEVEDGGCGFEDVEERVNTKAGGTWIRIVSYHRGFLLMRRIRRLRNSNVGVGVTVDSGMGVVEGLQDCWCRAGGKIGAGRCEAKRVEREVQ
jgi:hypothetical protein